MKKLKILILILTLILLTNEKFITKIINKINDNAHIETLSFKYPNKITITNLKYKNNGYKYHIEKISFHFKIKNIRYLIINHLKLKNTQITSNAHLISIKQINVKILIYNKKKYISMLNIYNTTKKKELTSQITISTLRTTLTTKYTIINNNTIIKKKRYNPNIIKISNKKIQTDIMFNKKNELIIKNYTHNDAIIKNLTFKIKNTNIKIKIFKFQIKRIIIKKIAIQIIITKTEHKININSTHIQILLHLKKINHKTIYVLKNFSYKENILVTPCTITTTKKLIKTAEIKIKNLQKTNLLIIKTELRTNNEKCTIGIFYIQLIKFKLPEIKILSRNKTLCNIYIKGKLCKSLKYTQQIIKI